MRLTLRTLLAYLDDTLPAEEAKLIGQKVGESETAQQLIETISRVTRRRALSTPATEGKSATDPNTVAEYLSDVLSAEQISDFENLCLESDVHLAEVAACHQILTLLLSEPVRVPPSARQRMYRLVTGPESLPNKKPSNTIPIGGILPDETLPSSDDSDAGYLLGMKAFGETETRGQRLAKVGLLTGLIGGLGLTVYSAWPSAKQPEFAQTRTVNRQGFIPPPKPVDEKDEKPVAVVPPPENPMAPARDPNSPREVAEPMKFAEAPKPMVETPPKDNSPRMDPTLLGKLTTPDRVLVVNRNGKWSRIGGAVPELQSTEKIVALPGYVNVLKLETGAELTLWGNLPELCPVAVRETSITAYWPRDGFAADLTLHAGRIYLTGVKPNLQQLRVRTGAEFWDITLQDPQTEVAVEVSRRLPSGSGEPNTDEKLRTEITLAVLSGRANVSHDGQQPLDLAANNYLTIVNTEKPSVLPKKLGLAPGLPANHFSRTPTAGGDPLLVKTAQELLHDFSENYKLTDPLRVRLEEYFVAQPPPPDESKLRMYKRTLRSSFGLAGLIAKERSEVLISALNDDTRPRVREAAAEALILHPAMVLEQWSKFSNELKEKTRFTDEQVRQFYQLLRMPNATDAATLDFLGELLSSPQLPLRELAFWQLSNSVDRDSQSTKPLSSYDAAATAEARESSTKAWKKRIEELKLRKPKS
jgi:hypothetical protein